MDTSQIKKFAIEARNKLKAGVAAKIQLLGFGLDGKVREGMMPQPVQGGCIWNGKPNTEGFYHLWMSLHERVQHKGLQDVVEEAAYTWFNRLMAIRILQKNGLIDPVLAYSDDLTHTPQIVDDARMGRIPAMDAATRERLDALLNDDRMVPQQFALLITAWCHNNPIVNASFGGIAQYTELLLPDNVLAEGGFISMLNGTSFITDEDYRSPELIGWLYQFYISERKDEVMAKNGKYAPDEIAPATQIFTPNWIVKYMVQNTIGRIYLDKHPEAAAKFKPKWQYLVDSEAPAGSHRDFNELTDLKCADLACGSGHILNEMFDVLYDLYQSEYYTTREAVENILTKNITGIDLDTRAKQLATFALLLKACQRDSSFADAHVMPRIMDMPSPIPEGEIPSAINAFFRGVETPTMRKEIAGAYKLMEHADSLGSIMKFDFSDSTRYAIINTLEHWTTVSHKPEQVERQLPIMQLILALTEKYDALVMNPPYMGSGKFDKVLSDYVNLNYPSGKADLATVFVEMMPQRMVDKGLYGFIIPPSWMFISKFEDLRKDIINSQTIRSLLHLSRGVFGADFGSSSAVIENQKNVDAKGTYFRLVERTFQEFDQKHLRMLFEQTLTNHDFKYKFVDYDKSVTELPYSDDGNQIYYPNVPQKYFEKIPGSTIGYWVSKRMITCFRYKDITAICDPRCGMSTGNNAHYVRLWHEVNFCNIGFCYTRMEAKISGKKWFPYDNAGGVRKWYGFLNEVVNWKDDGKELQTTLDPTGKRIWGHNFNLDKIFMEHIGWSDITSSINTFRYYSKGFLFSSSTNAVFVPNYNLAIVLAFCNSKLSHVFKAIFNPTMHFTPGNLLDMPFSIKNIERNYDKIKNTTKSNVDISKEDWDAHETSWDFRANPLVALANKTTAAINGQKMDMQIDDRLSFLVKQYKAEWEAKFMQLHANEEELNRQFIDIYGLQDELTPDVPLDEITILQQGEISIEDGKLVWHDDVLMKQLISYAAGCFMGRYRLDKPGLAIAYPHPSAQDLAPYEVNGRQFEIDDDAIFPLMPGDCGFSDNASRRLADFISLVFGPDTQAENLNYMERCLGKSIEQYFVKDFWKDHKKMYQNRPIYWLFSSKKGAFQVVAYMHRMTPWTVERIRGKYLQPFIQRLRGKEAELKARAAFLSTTETRKLDTLRKQIAECEEYHERLQVVAEQQISFDLDDGVAVNYAKLGDVVAKLK